MARLGANMIKHTYEMELYIILATLEKFECWNWTLLIMTFHHVKVQTNPVQCLLAMVVFSSG